MVHPAQEKGGRDVLMQADRETVITVNVGERGEASCRTRLESETDIQVTRYERRFSS